jgi:PPP family 3-phenylpropionic acid transporter
MNAPPAHAAAPPRYALRMWIFFAGYFVFGGVAVPFFPVWLDVRGLTDVEIAAVLAVPGLLRVAFTPFAGIFADRAPNRRFAVLCFTVPATFLFLFAWPAESFVPILIVVGLSFTLWQLALPVGEALALTGMRRFGLDYGKMRVGGSVAFIVTNLGAGALLTLLHAEAIFWLVFAALAISTLVSFGLPVTPPAIRALDDTTKPQRPKLGPVLREPAFLTLILVGALIQSSHAMLYSFGTLYWRELGFGGVEIGMFWAFAVGCEILLFQWSGPLMRRIGPFGFLTLGGVAATARWLLFPLDPGFLGYAALQGLHAFTFGAVYVGNQHAIARAVPEEVTASAQGVFAMVVGLLMAIVMLIAGPLYQALGGDAFAVMAILPLVALAILGIFRMRTGAATGA